MLQDGMEFAVHFFGLMFTFGTVLSKSQLCRINLFSDSGLRFL